MDIPVEKRPLLTSDKGSRYNNKKDEQSESMRKPDNNREIQHLQTY